MKDCPAKPAAMPCPATESHARHLKNLLEIPETVRRREYINGVRRAEGNWAANWLMDEYAKAHKARKEGAK